MSNPRADYSKAEIAEALLFVVFALLKAEPETSDRTQKIFNSMSGTRHLVQAHLEIKQEMGPDDIDLILREIVKMFQKNS